MTPKQIPVKLHSLTPSTGYIIQVWAETSAGRGPMAHVDATTAEATGKQTT